ncbi:hypothetical protein ACWDSD_24740 [Streptomyces spiralis]
MRSTTELSRHNDNYVGGDIVTGANDPWQLVFRPRLALDPYATGVPGVYLCSAATPPGADALGMCGYNAAQHALARLQGPPSKIDRRRITAAGQRLAPPWPPPEGL